MLDNYIISLKTVAVLPLTSSMSKVVEDEETYIIKKSTQEIIDYSCKYFGSSYRGRIEGTKALLGYNYKAPIVIDILGNVVFFPISSAKNNTSWFASNKIEKYEKISNNSKIQFKNGITIELSISYNSLENQILRSNYLNHLLETRKKVTII